MSKQEKHILREDGSRWCRLEVRLEDVSVSVSRDGETSPRLRLSICGSEGEILLQEDAERAAVEYWQSFFEECPEELGSLVMKWKDDLMPFFKECDTAEEACARLVVSVDGPLHGIDVALEKDGRVYVLQSCGQIRDELEQWFPEVSPYLKWHLNDMNAGCPHQEALGWGRGKTINLAREFCTPIQLEVLDKGLAEKVAKERVAWIDRELDRLSGSRHLWYDVLQDVLGRPPCVDDMDALKQAGQWTVKHLMAPHVTASKRQREVLVAILDHLRVEAEKTVPDQFFTVGSFKDSLGAPCPECGYEYGQRWLRRELPASVIEWFESLQDDG